MGISFTNPSKGANESRSIRKARRQLHRLAGHLARRRRYILQCWREVAERTPELTVVPSLTRPQFNDHIPGILDALGERLRAWPHPESPACEHEEEEQTMEHGVQRWRQGYQLPELTLEWGHLQMCLMEELESYASAHPDLEPPVMPTARRALANLCWDGINESVGQYWRMHQAEAAGRVHELEQALKTLSELDQMRATAWREAAHDLRGSVTMVTGAAALLNSESVPETMRQQSCDILQNGISGLHEMLNDLMDLARLAAGQEQRVIAPFDAATLMADFCKSSLPMAQSRGLFLEISGPESLPVEGDRAKVQRILQNLLLNALKYTESGGITVIWGACEGDDGSEWTFCVQDTGPGLDARPNTSPARPTREANALAHRLENGDRWTPAANGCPPLSTAHAQWKPLPLSDIPSEGIGLSIVKRLCEFLGASIKLETKPGEGSAFRVKLPRFYNH